MGGPCSRHAIHKKYIQIPEGNRPLAKSRCVSEDNAKMYLEETRCEGLDWIQLAQDGAQSRTLANTVMKLRIQYNA